MSTVRRRPCIDGTATHRQRERTFERVARRRPVVVSVANRRPRRLPAVPWSQLLARWEELGWYGCFYCDGHGPVEVDHVVPMSMGGLDGPANLVPACPGCNGAKGDGAAVLFTPWTHVWH
ncbi:HNH endonuclease [Kitasatospora sp. NPDC101183]|uniref:HNH endonuclease n=1 Tax=Kitasatospora sp. NPDC101183 TaxID=3364100 RepID=UPI003820FFDB